MFYKFEIESVQCSCTNHRMCTWIKRMMNILKTVVHALEIPRCSEIMCAYVPVSVLIMHYLWLRGFTACKSVCKQHKTVHRARVLHRCHAVHEICANISLNLKIVPELHIMIVCAVKNLPCDIQNLWYTATPKLWLQCRGRKVSTVLMHPNLLLQMIKRF